MVPEQQQRILGYFIEEAKDHLNTIEQGLLNLQATIGNPEMANEIFRAAHSVKGGAAMLGIESMQRTSHRLEDYFKVLKESPVQVDRPLESMFLRIFDALQELLEQLQGPFGLTAEKEQSIMTGVEPVFQQLEEHLEQLVKTTGGSIAIPESSISVAAIQTPQPVEESALKLVFSSDVSETLREMLARFKQADTDDTRNALKTCCQLLEQFGEQFSLPAWLNLSKHARWAVCDRNNDYRTLAPVLIKEIKKAQDFVLAGREPEILISETLQTLAADSAANEHTDDTDNFDALFTDSLFDSSDASLELGDLEIAEDTNLSSDALQIDSVAPDINGDDPISLDDLLNEAAISQSGPEVGAAELMSLADLFETSSDELDSDWQEEDVSMSNDSDMEQRLDADVSPDFEDLLADATPVAASDDFTSGNELADLFGDTDIPDTASQLSPLDAASNRPSAVDARSVASTAPSDNLDSIDDLFIEASEVDDPASVDELFGDLAPETETSDELLTELDTPSPEEINIDLLQDSLFAEVSEPSEPATIDDMASVDELFGGLAPETETSDELLTELDTPSPEEINIDLLQDSLFAEVSEPSEPAAIDDMASVDELFGDLVAPETETSDELLAELNNPSPEEIDIGFPEESKDSLDLDELELLAESNVEEEDNSITLTALSLDEVGAQDSEPMDTPETDLALDLSGALGNDVLDSDTSDFDAALKNTHDSSQNDEWFSSASLEITDQITSEGSLDGGDFFTAVNEPESEQRSVAEPSEFDDFFEVDASTQSAQIESLADDLWDIGDNAAVVDTADDLLTDIWAENSSSDDLTLETAEPSPETLTTDDSNALDLDDLWASTEESLADDGTSSDLFEDSSDVSTTQPDLENLFGSEPDGLVDGSRFNSPEALDASMASLDDREESGVDELFGDTPLESSEISSLDDIELTTETVDTAEYKANLDTDLLNTPPSNDLEFDLLDLEDGGIVTGFVDDMPVDREDLPDSALEIDLLANELKASPSGLSDFDLSTTTDAAVDAEAVPEAYEFTTADEFGDLDALLDSPSSVVSSAAEAISDQSLVSPAANVDDDEFGDLEALLQDADQTLTAGATSAPAAYRPSANRLPSGRRTVTDQTMRVSVGHLDNLSNLVGELVVNRNTLEQDQERLRQFLDNLLFQVQQLNDVGQRMRDLYERSLLESSLISSRQSYQMANSGGTPISRAGDHATGESFDALEMDRFTGFHTLSQEMIELIVRVRESASDIAYTVESSDQVTRQFRQVTNQLQEGLNKARMVPFAQTAARLPRAVRDISLKCGKEARLVVEGRDILIDKMILEQLYDPMTHLVNNAITHGIESPEYRQAAGKSSEGVITVQAFYQGNQTVISVGDDGAGIDPAMVKQKALEKGLITPSDVQSMTLLDVYDLLFHPGFSTRDQADDFAGRGFGMDVVRTSLADIRGNITVDSEPGRGTTFTIRLPLTLSISKALSCVSNQARIAFPMDGVEDMFDVACDRIQKNDQDQDCILWRDNLLPFQKLSDLLSFNRTLGRGRVYGGNQDENIVSIVVLRSTNSFIALQVDQVMGEQEIVIKQLEGPVPKPTGIAGATVLGDGRVMPIADVLELIDLAMGRVRREPSTAMWTQVEEAPPESMGTLKSEPTVLIVDDSITVRELLSMSFNKVGYRVEQARDGQEAWEKLRSGLPCDLVFCDIEMPRMDGLELLSRLQKDSGLKAIPIAMLTSRGADRHRQMAVDLGASGYFTKPYLEEALLDAANKMLHGERLV
ncbi:MAG: response regulator [Cyanobacteria bacterium P01_D01_bin.156]